MYNNNFNNNFNGPMGPMGVSMYGNQNMRKISNEKSTLTPEQVKMIMDNRNKTYSLQIPEMEFMLETCNHQEHGLIDLGDGTFKCKVCGERIVFNDYTKEDVQSVVNTFMNIMDMVKIQDRILPDGVKQEVFKIGAIIKKFPTIAEMVFNDSQNAINQTNLGRANIYGANDVFRTIDMMTGAGMNTGMNPNPQFQQPMNPNAVNMNPYGSQPMNNMYGQQQPQMNNQMGYTPQQSQMNPNPQYQQMGYQNQPTQAPFYNNMGQSPEQPNYLDANSPVYGSTNNNQAPVAPKMETTSTSLNNGVPKEAAKPVDIDPNTGKPRKTV